MLACHPRALIVANAPDSFKARARRKLPESEYDPYSEVLALGFSGSDQELRLHLGQREHLAKRLGTCDMVRVLEGNRFVLRRAMAISGFDGEVLRRLRSDELVYRGFSAGAVVASRG